jgi:hypothetical protein
MLYRTPERTIHNSTLTKHLCTQDLHTTPSYYHGGAQDKMYWQCSTYLVVVVFSYHA